MKSLLAALALVGLVQTASAAPISLDLQLGGGSVVAWEAGDETGNAIGALVEVGFGDFAVGAGAAAVMPDSRLQGDFGTFWVEGRWYLLGRGLLAPYAVVGLGFSTEDGFERDATGFVPARWSTDPGFVGMLGAGLRFGAPTGLFLAGDARVWNHTHLGLSLLAGFTFF